MRSSVTLVARRMAGVTAAAVGIDQAGRTLCDWEIDKHASGSSQRALMAINADVPHRAWREGPALEQLAALLAVEDEWQVSGSVGGEAGLCAAVRAGTGHSLYCEASLIPNAGDGIFASGAIPSGRVLSVYAGMHRCPWDSVIHRTSRLLLPLLWEDGYMLNQADYSSIDGAKYTAAYQRKMNGYVVPSACTQLVNHPPSGSPANAAFLCINIPPSSAFDRIPVQAVWRKFASQPQVATLLVSIASIKDGEEVLVDYGFAENGSEFPEWYAPCVGPSKSKCMNSWSGPSLRDYMENEGFR